MRFFRRNKPEAVDEEIIQLVREFYKARWEGDHEAFNAIVHSKTHIPLKTPHATFLYEPVRYEIRARFKGYIIASFHSQLLKVLKDGKVIESPAPIFSEETWELRKEVSTGEWKVWDKRLRGHTTPDGHSGGWHASADYLDDLFTGL
jgi:hypothetical protein